MNRDGSAGLTLSLEWPMMACFIFDRYTIYGYWLNVAPRRVIIKVASW